MPISHKQPIPQCCDVCSFIDILFTDNEIIYGINRGKWHKCYYCPNCKATVGCHPDSNIPKGLMATSSQRRYRVKAHAIFDELWKSRLCSRDEAYQWMAEVLTIKTDDAHIGLLTREQLETLIALCPERISVLERRKVKQHAKGIKRFRREQQTINRGKR